VTPIENIPFPLLSASLPTETVPVSFFASLRGSRRTPGGGVFSSVILSLSKDQLSRIYTISTKKEKGGQVQLTIQIEG